MAVTTRRRQAATTAREIDVRERSKPRRKKVGDLVEEVPADYDSRFLACRDLRHAWAEEGWYRGSAGGIHRFLTCMRCGTEAHDDDYGFDRRRTYRYPDGYAIEGGVDVGEVRLALRDRADVKPSLDELRKQVARKLAR